MASGKSKVGSDLAGRLDYSFSDLDDLFEGKYRISIYDFFEKYGESVFRKIESQVLHETGNLTNAVIATGGGTPCFFDNMSFIKRTGYSIYLKWSVPALVHRLKNIKRKRPVLKDFEGKDLMASVKEHLRSREIFYNQAELIVEPENDDLDTLVSTIIPNLKEKFPF